jgi:hypothetical protein
VEFPSELVKYLVRVIGISLQAPAEP